MYPNNNTTTYIYICNIIDTVMISSLGEESVASIGVANQYFFLFNMALSGIVGGSGVFISQFYGKMIEII